MTGPSTPSGAGAPVTARAGAAADGAASGAAATVDGAFYVMATGQIEGAEFPGETKLFCTYLFSSGPDWTVVQGVDTAVSQISHASGEGDAPRFVWNFPVDVTFKSTNPHGWPRLIVTVVSRDLFHRYVVRGYGSVVIPTVPGRHVRDVHTFAPAASSKLQEIAAYLRGDYPQFYDAKFVARSEGREVTRVRSLGTVRVSLDITTKGLESHGYAVGSSR